MTKLMKQTLNVQASTLRKFFIRQISQDIQQLQIYGSWVSAFQYENCFILSVILMDIFENYSLM